jgi:nucleoside-diphosphate-sugar epimerase
MKDDVPDPLTLFREVNVEGTLNLARQAVKSGVRRFIYISSAKVNGEYTQPNLPFGPEHIAMPEDHYSISKYEAEQGLLLLAKKSKMEVVIIRPPLVYGPGVKGNFLHMMHLLQKGLPLPLGALKKNKRSFVSVDNLANFITTCISHPNAANQIFLVSDDEDLSTTDLLRKIQLLLGARVPLLPVPSWILNTIAGLLGRKSEIKRLCGSLQVDISKARELLNWAPIETVDIALHRAVHDYMKMSKSISE